MPSPMPPDLSLSGLRDAGPTPRAGAGTSAQASPGRLARLASRAALGMDARNRISTPAMARRGGLAPLVSLMTGTDDETLSLTNCVAAADTTNYRVGDRGWKLTASGAGAMVAALSPVSPASSGALAAPPWQALSAWIYIPDATQISGVTLYIYTDATFTSGNRWGKDTTVFPAQTLVNGWNLIRVPADFTALPAAYNQIYRVAVVATATATGATVTIGHVYLETPTKARILIVQDGGYTSFWKSAQGYADLKARGVPVTLAADMTLLGQGTGYFGHITQAELLTAAAENGNSISVHSYDGSTTSGMTAAQIRADSAKSIKFLQSLGCEGRMWRAAYVQNNAPNAAAANFMFVGQATGQTSRVGKYNLWPPQNLMDIARAAIDNNTATTASIDARFAFLQQTHMLDVPFFHGIDDSQTFGTSSALWQRFLSNLDAGIAAGWLECVTFEQLYYESGGSFSEFNGAHVAVYTDATGARVTKPIL
jgi:hypothetical protein